MASMTWLDKAEGYCTMADTLYPTKDRNKYALNGVGLFVEMAIKGVLRHYLDARGIMTAAGLHTVDALWTQVLKSKISVPFGPDTIMWLQTSAATMTLYYNKIRSVKSYVMTVEEVDVILEVAHDMVSCARGELAQD